MDTLPALTSDDAPTFTTLGDDPPPAPTGATTTTAVRYYYVNGLRVAEQRDGAWTWPHSDHLHSATVVTDASGTEVRRLSYRAFGEEAENTGTGDAPKYTYTAKEADHSGLMYYGARYYDPVLARFIAADTMYDRGPQGLNRYSYTLNNPIRYTDPTGHYVDADVDREGVYDDGPTSYGNVTGSQEQFANGTATVHDGAGGDATMTVAEYEAGGYSTFPAEPRIYQSPYPHRETNQELAYLLMHIGASVACEPYDWGATFYAWSQGDFSYWDLAGFLPLLSVGMIKHIDEAEGAVKALHSSGELMGVEKASSELLEAVTRKGRTLDFALPGTDDLRYLDSMPAEAAVGGPEYLNILVRENPSKAAVLEEFLHGTQHKLGVIDELGRAGAERHVKDFMIRHQGLLGLSGEDVEILKQLKDAGL